MVTGPSDQRLKIPTERVIMSSTKGESMALEKQPSKSPKYPLLAKTSSGILNPDIHMWTQSFQVPKERVETPTNNLANHQNYLSEMFYSYGPATKKAK